MNRLWVRLSSAFLMVSLAIMLVIVIVLRFVVEQNFLVYVDDEETQQIAEILETAYTENGSWEAVENILLDVRSSQGAGNGRQGGGGGGSGRSGGGENSDNLRDRSVLTHPFILTDTGGFVLISTNPNNIGDTIPATTLNQRAVTLYDEQDTTIGMVLMDTPREIENLNQRQIEFLDEIQLSMIGVAVAAAFLAMMVGVGFSLFLVRPLRQLTRAAQAVAEGGLGQTVVINRGDAAEITTLSRSFNQMSQALATGEDQRRRMASDIAHELRTPLSVMRSQLQAMLEGVHSVDEEHVAIVFSQTLHLTRLVDDLRTLTQAESGHLPMKMESLSPTQMVRRAATLFSPIAQDSGINLKVIAADRLPSITGDPDRLQQVFANLLSNALRHTPQGDDIILNAVQAGNLIRFSVSNSGGSLTPELAEHVFDRFWRADEARSRDAGGSGLGLAISREIINMHGGRIFVRVEGGLTHFIFEIPIN